MADKAHDGNRGDPSREQAVELAVREWKEQLIDRSGRNRLLYYRDLKVGTLRLDEAASPKLQKLIEGESVKLSALFPHDPTDPDRFDGVLKRARAVWKKSVENLEERGVETLLLAVGMAGWETDTTSSTPNAPVFVNALRLEPAGAGRTDFKLQLAGEWEVNATLLHLLESAYGLRFDTEPIVEAFEDSGCGLNEAARELQILVAGVPGFAVRGGVVAGNFDYRKLPMVQDLEQSIEFLADNDLIAAIAGDQEAQRKVRSNLGDPADITLPDRTPPEDEYLILDADSSQSRVINSVLAGASLVIQGPPGTGKSQTIANLVATLAARGKRILFVAEKRAAIEAVVKRLEEVKLGHLVMDLHGGISSKRETARRLGDSLEARGSTPLSDYSENHCKLEGARSRLNEYRDAVHRRWEPWDVSVWEIHKWLLGLDPSLDHGVRFQSPALEKLDPDTRREVRGMLGEWAERSRDFRTGVTPWMGATVLTEDDAKRALETVREIADEAAPLLRETIESVLSETELARPKTLQEWEETLHLLADVEQVGLEAAEALWSEDLRALAEALEPAGKGFWARLRAQIGSTEYRDAKKRMRSLTKDDRRGARRLKSVADDAISASIRWSERSNKQLPVIPTQLSDARFAQSELAEQLAAFGAYMALNQQELSTEKLGQVFRDYAADAANLRELPVIKRLEAELNELGVSELIPSLWAEDYGTNECQKAFDLAWCASAREHMMKEDRVLREFNARVHHRTVEEFQESDRDHLQTSARRVARRVAEATTRSSNEHSDQTQLIRNEAGKKTRHKPLRLILEKAPEFVTALKPCWVMSPLVVSQMLPRTELFDVVIFDEASQVLPADAVPALARAPQAVIAGDREQLPPTKFFQSSSDGAATETEEDEELAESALTEGYESILDVTSALLPEYMLTWHYRSQDERLIAFSNHQIYGGALTTFPGVGTSGALKHKEVGFTPDQAVNTRSNPDEVDRVVTMMIDHASRRPEETLGVIAMGITHANRIEERLEKRLRDGVSTAVDDFFRDTSNERPFVKSLERVQGDERDAIILSVGYGKDHLGRMALRFGPLNQEGGHRRLNVAVTRAKRRVSLVSSFGANEIDLSRTSARGVELLKSYIEYVDSGGSEILGAEIDAELNPFELSVRHRLEKEGLSLVPQHGVGEYRIDFAVRHPDKPSEFVLAIEADGASYHSSSTARDRDRLRQQILESHGWRFHRIWSTSWFNDQEAEVARALQAYKKALEEDPCTPPPTQTAQQPEWTDTPARIGKPPIAHPNAGIENYSDRQLLALIRWIKSDTLLRTDDELISEAMSHLGFKRRGTRIVERLNRAIFLDR